MRRELRHFTVPEDRRGERFDLECTPVMHMVSEPVEPIRVEPYEYNRQCHRDQHQKIEDPVVVDHEHRHEPRYEDQCIGSEQTQVRRPSLHRVHTDVVVDRIHLMHIAAESVKMVKDRDSFRECVFGVIGRFERHVPDRCGHHVELHIILDHLFEVVRILFGDIG